VIEKFASMSGAPVRLFKTFKPLKSNGTLLIFIFKRRVADGWTRL
jgi:hypothetical protein